MFVYYADFIDLFYFFNMFIARAYLEQLGVGGNIIRAMTEFVFRKWEKTSRRMSKPKNNITMVKGNR